MSNLIERLRSRQESRYDGGSQDHGWYADELCHVAAAEIERLRAALEPFALVVPYDFAADDELVKLSIKASAFRRAREALEAKKE
jgi:hypothetical protein